LRQSTIIMNAGVFRFSHAAKEALIQSLSLHKERESKYP
jgi:hypothetical protein